MMESGENLSGMPLNSFSEAYVPKSASLDAVIKFFSGPAAPQLRAARALLGWSQQRLADGAGVSLSTIRRLEGVDSYGRSGGDINCKVVILDTLERAGIMFQDMDGDIRGGVILRNSMGDTIQAYRARGELRYPSNEIGVIEDEDPQAGEGSIGASNSPFAKCPKMRPKRSLYRV